MNMATQTKKAETPWNELTPDEKLQKRIDAWLAAPDIKFVSPQAEADYRARINRFLDAVTLRKMPDRVPVMPNLGGFIQEYYGCSEKDMFYNPDKTNEASLKATLEFQIDTQINVGGQDGRLMEILDAKQYNWPGHGIPEDGEYQFLEGDYMRENEYDALIRDPSDYWLRVYLPRVYGAMEPLKNLNPFVHMIEMTGSVPSNMSRFAMPEVQQALKKLVEAGEEAVRWQQKVGSNGRKLAELGFPGMNGGNCRAPFDALGDALRGTRGIAYDMFRQPDKLIEAMERMVPLLISMGLSSVRMGGAPIVGFALHKGSDPYMSDEHFRKFYWPSLRKVMMAFINEGLIVRGGNQGFHNKRLEYYRDMPKGRVYWAVGYGTDIARMKDVLNGVACIMGNVHASLLHHGSVEQVVEYCKQIIDVAGNDGGYIFSTSSIDRHAKVENVRAMIKCAKEYGVYK